MNTEEQKRYTNVRIAKAANTERNVSMEKETERSV